MAKQDGHPHKCKECGKEYKHYPQGNEGCKEPVLTTCGACKK